MDSQHPFSAWAADPSYSHHLSKLKRVAVGQPGILPTCTSLQPLRSGSAWNGEGVISKQGSFNSARGLHVSLKVNSAGLEPPFVTREEDAQKAGSPCQSKRALEKLSDINILTHTCMRGRMCTAIWQTHT